MRRRIILHRLFHNLTHKENMALRTEICSMALAKTFCPLAAFLWAVPLMAQAAGIQHYMINPIMINPKPEVDRSTYFV